MFLRVLMRHCSQTTYNKSCQAPMGCFFKRLLGANHPSGGFLTDGMSSPCQGMSSPCFSMPFAHIVACLAISWHALSSLCRGMPCQAHVEAMSSPCRGMSSTSRAMAWPLQPHPFSFMHLSRHVVTCLVEPIASQLLLIASKCFQVPKSQRPKSPRALVP